MLSEQGPSDLYGLIGKFVQEPLSALYFFVFAFMAVALVWAAFRFAFPRPGRLQLPRWNVWIGLVALFAAVAVQTLFYFAIGAALGVDMLVIDPMASALATIASVPVICIGGYHLLKALLRSRPVEIGISPRGIVGNSARGLLLVVMLYPLFYFLAFCSTIFLNTIGVDTSEQLVVQMARQGSLFLTVVLFVMALAAPFWEEFVFRGALFGALRRAIGVDEAIIISAAIFAMFHGSVAAFPPIFFLAVFLAYAYERTGSLWTPIAMHFVFNGLNMLPIILAKT